MCDMMILLFSVMDMMLLLLLLLLPPLSPYPLQAPSLPCFPAASCKVLVFSETLWILDRPPKPLDPKPLRMLKVDPTQNPCSCMLLAKKEPNALNSVLEHTFRNSRVWGLGFRV